MSSVGNPETVPMVPSRAEDAGWDGIGMIASCLCVVHCLGFPLLVAALPALSSVLGEGEAFHIVILAIAIPSSLFALWVGRARHFARWPLMIGVVGLAFLTLALLEILPEIAGTVTGSLMLVSAHIANWHYRRGAAI